MELTLNYSISSSLNIDMILFIEEYTQYTDKQIVTSVKHYIFLTTYQLTDSTTNLTNKYYRVSEYGVFYLSFNASIKCNQKCVFNTHTLHKLHNHYTLHTINYIQTHNILLL